MEIVYRRLWIKFPLELKKVNNINPNAGEVTHEFRWLCFHYESLKIDPNWQLPPVEVSEETANTENL